VALSLERMLGYAQGLSQPGKHDEAWWSLQHSVGALRQALLLASPMDSINHAGNHPEKLFHDFIYRWDLVRELYVDKEFLDGLPEGVSSYLKSEQTPGLHDQLYERLESSAQEDLGVDWKRIRWCYEGWVSDLESRLHDVMLEELGSALTKLLTLRGITELLAKEAAESVVPHPSEYTAV